MSTSAAAVDLLMKKGHLDPHVALAIAEAVGIIMTEMQVVTIPVLDARFAEVDRRFAEIDSKIDLAVARLEKLVEVTCECIKSELVRWVFITMTGSVAMQATVTAIVNSLQHR
jgi:hypothetical protein